MLGDIVELSVVVRFGFYLVGFECKDVPGSVERLKKQGVRVDHRAYT